jgi:hypothetical protein
MNTLILDVHGREILDSRGNPTVEVEVLCSKTAQSVWLPFLQEQALVKTKQLSFATAIKTATLAKAPNRQ